MTDDEVRTIETRASVYIPPPVPEQWRKGHAAATVFRADVFVLCAEVNRLRTELAAQAAMIRDLVEKGVLAEREVCALLSESMDDGRYDETNHGEQIAAAIRARTRC